MKKALHPYWQPLEKKLLKLANPTQAMAAEKYMRHHFSFYGIYAPILKENIREFWMENGIPGWKDSTAIIQSAFAHPNREFQYAAIQTFYKWKKEYDETAIDLCEWMITHKSWWDSVDSLHKPNAWIYEKIPSMKKRLDQWAEHDDFWLRRAAICFQLSRKERTEEKILYRYCLMNADSKEFFIQKAIGWSLREYARYNSNSVIRFVRSNALKPLSIREALKHFPDIRASIL